jgi:hypothetical protein
MSELKALTLTQPWASLMALREKKIETRSWYTTYRGEIVIHAAKGFPRWAKDTCYEPAFRAALGGVAPKDLPLSLGLCVVRLVACIPTDQLNKIELALGSRPRVAELMFGDYSDGRFAWVTEYLYPLKNQRPVKGALGLWAWPVEVAA